MVLLKYIKKALFNPERNGYSHSLLKTFLKKPIVFDLASLVLQWGQLKRQDKVLKENQEKDDHFQDVFEYNASVTDKKRISTTRRPEEYYRILEACSQNRDTHKILLIGPRDVFELYIAWLYGFKWENIHSIDLYSTHPKIEVMNMEDMTFEDESFDYVVLSRVYGYSKDPRGFIKGLSRILKKGGKVVFEANFVPDDDRWPTNRVSGRETIKFMNECNLNIAYYKYYEKINGVNLRQASHLIGATKVPSSQDAFDPIVFIPKERATEPRTSESSSSLNA